MSKVIRTARISEHRVVLPLHLDPDQIELLSSDVFAAQQAAEAAESEGFTPLGEGVEVLDDDGMPIEDDVIIEADPEPEPEPEPDPEPEPELAAADIEAMVEARVQEFETRFQQEKEEAQRAGYEMGYAKGLEEGQAQSQDEIVRVQAMLAVLAERWDDLFKTADLSLLEVALAVVRNILGGAVEIQNDLVLQAVRDCLNHVQDLSRITIRVHPEDLDLVRSQRSRWRETYEQIETLNIEADPDIGRGGCVVETPSGDIDAQIDARLEKLRAALIESLQNAPAQPPPDLDVEIAEADGLGGAEMNAEIDPNAQVEDRPETPAQEDAELMDDPADSSLPENPESDPAE